MKGACKEMVKVHKGRGMVQAAVAERLSALGEEDDAVALKEEDREEFNMGLTLGTLNYTEEWTRALESC